MDIHTTIVATAVSRAVNILLGAGMVLRYTSADGCSFYLGWPGRSGVLRVSDHAASRTGVGQGNMDYVYARLTLDVASLPATEDQFQKRLAEGLGRYLLKAPPDD